MVNYFADGMDAARYAKARPDIHRTAVERFLGLAEIEPPLSLALDVGCGTGQSTIVLAKIAKRVIGIDPSLDMLSHAAQHPNVEYRQSAAEKTPFCDARFDLITAAQAYHWFNHGAFLSESYRVLRVPGWLLVYTSWFTGEMKDEPTFSDWFKGEYLRRYPAPPRDRTPITEELAERHGFVFRGEDEFSNQVGMTIDRFTDYQLSTTNVIAAVREGEERFDDAARWLLASLGPYFPDECERVFLFSGKMWCLAKSA
jgi:SAM-dependent methyltransferase